MSNSLFGGVKQLFVGQMLFYQIYMFVSIFTLFGIPICLMLGKPIYVLLLGALLILEYFAFDDWLSKTELKKHTAKEGKIFLDVKIFHSEFSQEMVIPVSKKSQVSALPIEFKIEEHSEYQKASLIEINTDASELEEFQDQDFDKFGIRKIDAKKHRDTPLLTENREEKDKNPIPIISLPAPEEPEEPKNEEEDLEDEEAEAPSEIPSNHTLITEKKQKMTTQLQQLGINPSKIKEKKKS